MIAGKWIKKIFIVLLGLVIIMTGLIVTLKYTKALDLQKKGDILVEANAYEEAVKAYRQSLQSFKLKRTQEKLNQIQDTYNTKVYDQANEYISTNNYEEALKEFQKLDPNYKKTAEKISLCQRMIETKPVIYKTESYNLGEFKKRYDMFLAYNKKTGGTIEPKDIKNKVLDQLADDLVIAEYARDNRMLLTDKEFQESWDKFVQASGGEANIANVLLNLYGTSVEEFKKMFWVTTLEMKVRKSFVSADRFDEWLAKALKSPDLKRMKVEDIKF